MSQHGIAAAAATARPVSYATRDQARAYVTSLTRTGSTAPVYLIASPAARDSYRWPRWTAELAALLPGLELITWRDLPGSFTGVPIGQCPARLAGALRGAIVLPDKQQGRRWIGRTARSEARAFAAAGKPVLVYAEGRLTAWPDCRLVFPTRPDGKEPRRGLSWPHAATADLAQPRAGTLATGGELRHCRQAERPGHHRPGPAQARL